VIYFHSHALDEEVAGLVKLSFIRSYTKSQVVEYSQACEEYCVHVFINPVNSDLDIINKISCKPSKIIILGNLPPSIASVLGLVTEGLPVDAASWDQCDAAPTYEFSESDARIKYDDLPGDLECHIIDRPLLRYDFAAEWNNLGFGHVRTDDSMWSLACKAEFVLPSDARLASVYKGDEELTIYATLSTQDQSEILWVNRPVGLVDTQEFRLFETFISNYKSDDLPCLPLIREIPYGYDAMVSMRLDCDEDIASARPLFELYRSSDIPFSLALRTSQLIDQADINLVTDVLQDNGSVLSHSANHKVNWGEDYSDVLLEAEISRKEIEDTFGVACVDYAVSPFHQNPDYAVQALNDANYKGFISGIVCNDPQYLLARGGEISTDLDIVTHSQQCMLHGDCLLKNSADPLVVFKKSAEYSMKSGAVFAYLDHPFSERYQYGWSSEYKRVAMHRDWIEHLQGLGKVLFVNEVNLLHHIRKKNSTRIWLADGKVKSSVGNPQALYQLAYEFEGNVQPIL